MILKFLMEENILHILIVDDEVRSSVQILDGQFTQSLNKVKNRKPYV